MHKQLFQNVKDILEKNYLISKDQHILLIYDLKSLLSTLLTNAYQKAIQTYPHDIINFHGVDEEFILTKFQNLPKRSLVILVQSGSFRMTKHRLRADLFQQGHMVIEHARLSFNDDNQIENYINALNYDTPYYLKKCNKIAHLLQENKTITVKSENNLTLTINSKYENPIKNTGDFSQNSNASAGFPIGEIFTEAQELDKINGQILVFATPTLEHHTFFTDPFIVTIKDGLLISHNGPDKFNEMLNIIRAEENNKVQVREIGFGLNRALGFSKRLNEPTAFERFAGLHFSLGMKHAMYRKKFDKDIVQKYHVDIFCLVDEIFIGNIKIFEKGEYLDKK